jgi:hypothetical protein
VFNVSNCAGEDNPYSWVVQPAGPPCNWVVQPAGPAIDTWTQAEADQAEAYLQLPSTAQILAFVRVSSEVLIGLPRRISDRLFNASDSEAHWRGWQTLSVHGGLARRYRDPRFDALSACPRTADR